MSELTAPWKETTLRTILSRYKLITQINVVCFFVFNLISHLIFNLRLAQGENAVKFVLVE